MQYGELEIFEHFDQFDHDGSVTYDIYDGYYDDGYLDNQILENEEIPF